MNKTILIGRITKDLDLRKTPSGNSVIRFTLAVTRNFKNAAGEKESDFISCQAWNKTAELMERFLSKGSLIGVEGNIRTGSYQDNKTGNKVYTTDVMVESVEFLESSKKNQQSPSQQATHAHVNGTFQDFEGELPF